MTSDIDMVYIEVIDHSWDHLEAQIVIFKFSNYEI